MTSSATSGSASQLIRKQGLARTSAATVGVAAAGILGAIALAITLSDSIPAGTGTSVSATASNDEQ